MKHNRHRANIFWIIAIVGMAFMIMSCNNKNDTTEPVRPADPGPGNLAGIVMGTIAGHAMSNVTVSVGDISDTTDSKGRFLLEGVGEGILGVLIRGVNVYTRTASVNTANGRFVFLDAIEVDSAFNVWFYRELVRGNHPDDNEMLHTHRWINPNPPTVYINTYAGATLDGVVDQETIDAVSETINEIVGIFTGGVYSSVTIQTQMMGVIDDFNDIPDNAIVFMFDDSLYFDDEVLGFTSTLPNFMSPTANTINKAAIMLLDSSYFYILEGISVERVIAHESGHAFGFRHTSLLPSIMSLDVTAEGLYSEADELHMSIMYHRPPGNTDIDDDPVPTTTAKMLVPAETMQAHVDRLRHPVTLPPELLERAKTLRGHGIFNRSVKR